MPENLEARRRIGCWQEVDGFLFRSMLFSVLLILARILYTGSDQFMFLIWNLFLAALPYLMVKALQSRPAILKRKWLFAALFAGWLLFLPNSFYILTDLLHLNGRASMMKWFDVTLIISFAWNGVLLGVLAIRSMEQLIAVFLTRRRFWFFLLPVMTMNALGIYIGRYLRFNSWDVISNPLALGYDLLYMLRHPFMHGSEWLMIGCFSVFMTLVYSSFRKLASVLR